MRSFLLVFALLVASATAEAKPVRHRKAKIDPAYAAAMKLVNDPPLFVEDQANLLATAPVPYVVQPATEPNGTDAFISPFYFSPGTGQIMDCTACFSEETFSPWFLQSLRVKAAYDAATVEIWKHHGPKSVNAIVPMDEADPLVHPIVMRQWAASTLVWGYAVDLQHAGFLAQMKRLVSNKKTSNVVPGFTWRSLNKAGVAAALKFLPDAANEEETDLLSDLVTELAGVIQGHNAAQRGRAYDAILGELQDEDGC